MNEYSIIVVDDERPVRQRLIRVLDKKLSKQFGKEHFSDSHYQLDEASSLNDIKRILQLENIKRIIAHNDGERLCVVLDHKFEGLESDSGLIIAKWLKENCHAAHIIALSGYHGENYKAYVRLGSEVVDKDENSQFYVEISERVDSWMSCHSEAIDQVENSIRELFGTHSNSTKQATNMAANLARQKKPNKYATLITGISGSGKNYLAGVIHQVAQGNDLRIGDLQIVNVLSSDNTQDIRIALFGSELKDNKVQGAFRSAENGTVVIDEVGSYPLEVQKNLLTAISPGYFTPVFGKKQEQNKAWVIFTTNYPDKIIKELRSRCFRIELPSLSQRQEDISILLKNILSREEPEYYLGLGARQDLLTHNWQDLRQIEKVILATVMNKKAKAKKSQQIGPEEINWDVIEGEDSIENFTPGINQESPITSSSDQSLEGDWWSELDRKQLMDLCREIWKTKGGIIDNEVNNIIEHVSNFPGHPLLNTRFILAIFYVAYLGNKKTFKKKQFEDIFGFSGTRPYRIWLRGKSDSQQGEKYFPKHEDENGEMKPYSATQLKADGYKLRQNGIFLDIGQ